jgi:hypothetical protein
MGGKPPPFRPCAPIVRRGLEAAPPVLISGQGFRGASGTDLVEEIDEAAAGGVQHRVPAGIQEAVIAPAIVHLHDRRPAQTVLAAGPDGYVVGALSAASVPGRDQGSVGGLGKGGRMVVGGTRRADALFAQDRQVPIQGEGSGKQAGEERHVGQYTPAWR